MDSRSQRRILLRSWNKLVIAGIAVASIYTAGVAGTVLMGVASGAAIGGTSKMALLILKMVEILQMDL